MNDIEANKTSTVLSNGLTAVEFCALGDSGFLAAVRLVRARLGLGLFDAKALIVKAVPAYCAPSVVE